MEGLVIVGVVTMAIRGMAVVVGAEASTMTVMCATAVGGTSFVAGLAALDFISRRVSSMKEYMKAALAGSIVGAVTGAAELVPVGGLARVEVDFLAGAFGSAAGQLITEGEVDAERMFKEGVLAAVMAMGARMLRGGMRTGTERCKNKIGDFSDLEGSTVDEILDRIPDEATLRELRPVEGGATEGFEFKWVQDGKTYRVRVHNADPGAPKGSNAANGWVVRVQRGKQYYDYTINDFQPARYTNVKGDYFDEKIMNNTHIPIVDPYSPFGFRSLIYRAQFLAKRLHRT